MTERRRPERDAVLAELRVVRRIGPLRLHEVRLPALDALATPPGGVEELLRGAAAGLENDTLRQAVGISLGLAPGTSDWPAADRRKRAARVYGVGVDRFRHHQEGLVLGRLADHLLRTAPAAPSGNGPGAPSGNGPGSSSPPPVCAHYPLQVPGPAGTVPVTLHAHPVDLLRDVDVVVSPSNVYLALAEPYKASVSAALRRTGALSGPTGDVIEDRVHLELRAWLDRHGAAGRPVPPGTVAPTSAGALDRHGIRRVYHAALAVPRPGTNDYDVQPADVTRCAARALDLLAEERDRYRPPLRSICFPLLGAGRGGLSPDLSLRALWSAVEAALSRGADWELHLLVRRPGRAETVARILAGDA